uniref:Putative secreted protein n=1 Tax=Anopheles darlingi TaxID=43151 RepID=A0A2M4DKC7_ANODA
MGHPSRRLACWSVLAAVAARWLKVLRLLRRHCDVQPVPKVPRLRPPPSPSDDGTLHPPVPVFDCMCTTMDHRDPWFVLLGVHWVS